MPLPCSSPRPCSATSPGRSSCRAPPARCWAAFAWSASRSGADPPAEVYARAVLSRMLPERRPPLAAGVAVALAVVALETLVLFPLEHVAEPVSLALIYLLGVLLVSIVWGVAPGIATSLVSALAFNFFHIAPRGRFTIADGE